MGSGCNPLDIASIGAISSGYINDHPAGLRFGTIRCFPVSQHNQTATEDSRASCDCRNSSLSYSVPVD